MRLLNSYHQRVWLSHILTHCPFHSLPVLRVDAASEQISHQDIGGNIGIPAKFQDYIYAPVKVVKNTLYGIGGSMRLYKGKPPDGRQPSLQVLECALVYA